MSIEPKNLDLNAALDTKPTSNRNMTGEPDSETSTLDEDAQQMADLGYKQSLKRQWKFAENFAASFCAMNFIGVTRAIFFLGILAGGPKAMWSMQIVSMFLMWITAAVLAEICSAIPLSGSIYIWAAEAAGKKYSRFVGMLVAYFACTAWMTFSAGNMQTTANFIVSLLTVFEVDFPGGLSTSNVKFRVMVWGISEALLILVIALNYLPPRAYSWVFKGSMFLMLLDFLLCLIWLPIGAARSYGIRSASEAFMTTYNGTGAPPAWNWCIVFIYATGPLIGFDASGHVAEETKNASTVAARGIFTSAIASGLAGFGATLLFLFCTPPIDVWMTFTSPQPFVEIYALAFGKGGCVFMTVLAVLGLIANSSIAIVASSRLVFAVARDGVLPGSAWVGRVTPDGRPQNAVTVFYVFGAVLLCTILPSNVAFTSLVSAGAIPTIAAYSLIALCRLFVTPNEFKHTRFGLGKFGKPFYLIAGIWNAFLFAVLISPFVYPPSAPNFNYGPVIFGAAIIFAIATYFFTPEEKWLRQGLVANISKDVARPVNSQHIFTPVQE
ncbi:amino acid/polyamine transporter I [Mrakia frigida]|uniref:amino acid/polyamine transporter I n=1 Tax=Mrakia frigida TaxID=29902 RepID=UPI003FCC1D93